MPKNNDFHTFEKLAKRYNSISGNREIIIESIRDFDSTFEPSDGFLNDLLKLPINGVSEVYLNALTQTLLEVHFPEMAKLKNTPEPWV